MSLEDVQAAIFKAPAYLTAKSDMRAWLDQLPNQNWQQAISDPKYAILKKTHSALVEFEDAFQNLEQLAESVLHFKPPLSGLTRVHAIEGRDRRISQSLSILQVIEENLTTWQPMAKQPEAKHHIDQLRTSVHEAEQFLNIAIGVQPPNTGTQPPPTIRGLV